MATNIAELKGVSLSFGGLLALDDVNISIEEGTICALIGPNGAGKSTAFNCISRFYNPDRGDILFKGQSIFRYAPHQIAGLGIGRTFQNLELFEQMTVLDNILVGFHLLAPPTLHGSFFFTRRQKKDDQRIRFEAEKIIEFLDLEPYREAMACDIPYGVKKRTEIARALAIQPKMLLLDEPAAGLNKEEGEDLSWWILDIKEELGTTIFVIEHDLGFIMKLADSIAVLDHGKLIVQGPPEEVKKHPKVITAYVGKAENNAQN